MKVRLNALKIEDTQGNYGPQKKIRFKQIMDEGDRWLSGWVPENKFNANEWQEGKEVDLIITQKGDFWNFSLPNKNTAAIAAVEEKSNANHEKIMEALRAIYQKLNEMDTRINSNPIEP